MEDVKASRTFIRHLLRFLRHGRGLSDRREGRDVHAEAVLLPFMTP